MLSRIKEQKSELKEDKESKLPHYSGHCGCGSEIESLYRGQAVLPRTGMVKPQRFFCEVLTSCRPEKLVISMSIISYVKLYLFIHTRGLSYIGTFLIPVF